MKIRKNGKVVRLSESDLQRIVKRTLKEETESCKKEDSMPSRERPMCKEVGVECLGGEVYLVEDNMAFILWRDKESNCPKMCRMPSRKRLQSQSNKIN
jgi:hypothetical protein